MSQELLGEAGNVTMSKPNIQLLTTYKMCTSDLKKKSTSDLQKEYIQPTIGDHPTNKKSSSELHNIFIDKLDMDLFSVEKFCFHYFYRQTIYGCSRTK